MSNITSVSDMKKQEVARIGSDHFLYDITQLRVQKVSAEPSPDEPGSKISWFTWMINLLSSVIPANKTLKDVWQLCQI